MSTTTIDPAARRVPPLGGLNTTVLRIELRRMLRNRRTVIFTLVFPAALFFAFGSGPDWDRSVGHGNVAAYVMASMALYGAALTAASGGAMVAMERALGWSRQLRLTPLSPTAYILMKALLALVLGAVAITVVNLAGLAQGKPSMPTHVWLGCAVLTLVCTMVFAALGVFVGYLVPGENAMQVLGPGLALFSFLGNVFIPIHKNTRLVVQGITGKEGSFHTKQMVEYGTNVVGGVTPGKGGTKHEGLPVFNTVADAVAQASAN